MPPEFFPRLAANAPLILTVGAAGLLFGLAIALGAVWLFFMADFPVAKAAAGMVFFMASLILTPSIHLLRYRAEVVSAAMQPEGDVLMKVLHQQMRFWRFIGVATIVWVTIVGIGALGLS